MKYEIKYVLLFVTLLLAGLVHTTSVKKENKNVVVKYDVSKCPRTCNCLPTYQPVCGESGKTHSNECLAKCFNDKVKSQGPCKLPECDDRVPYVKKTVCSVKPYGRTGRRKHCCIHYTKGNQVIKASCSWVGCASERKVKEKCYWVKTDAYTKQMKCCKWEEKSCGKKFKKGPLKCTLSKDKYSTKKVEGCTLQPFGKYGKRQHCCTENRVCLNNKCKSEGKKCHYKGGWVNTIKRIKCEWKKKNSYSRQRECCEFTRTENYDEQGGLLKASEDKKGECKWDGKVINLPKVTKCEDRKYGRYGLRKRCCTFNNDCDLKNKCVQANVQCRWTGATTYRIEQSKCEMKKHGNCEQSFCCKWTRRCTNGKCVNANKKCSFTGQKYCKDSSNKCEWKKVKGNGVRKQCCETSRTCVDKKCKTEKKCKWEGPTITTSSKTTCFWETLEKHKKYQRKCCEVLTTCENKVHCKNSAPSCKVVGKPVVYKYSQGCTLKKTGKYTKRQYCCKNVKRCQKKDCKEIKKECKFTGVTYTNKPHKKCVTAKYPGNGCTRQRCCKWTEYCEDKKCKPVNKKCEWKGPVLKKTTVTKCHWKKNGKNTQRRSCCYYENKCVDKNCVEKKLRCSFTGVTLKTSHHKECYYKPRGDYVRQKYCCTKKKTCTGGKCVKQTKACGYVGPRFYRRPYEECKVKVQNKKDLTYRKECCSFVKSCVDKKCSVHDKKCKWQGPPHKLHHNTVCKFRQFGKDAKRNYCCHYSKKCTHETVKGKKVEKCKVVKHDCSFKGEPIRLNNTFYRKTPYCENVHNNTFKKCCTKLEQCTKAGNENKCVLKNKDHACKYTKLVESKYICISSGDPHYTSFDQKKFDFYKKGDFTLLKTNTVTIHTRLRTWGGASVNTQIAVKLNSVDVVESVSKYANIWLINKKNVVSLKDGQDYVLPNGGKITCRNNKVAYLYSKSGDFIDARFEQPKNSPQNGYITVIVKSLTTKNAYGLCASQNFISPAKGLFRHYYEGTDVVKTKCTGETLKKAEASCKSVGVVKADFQDCVTDVCNKMPAAVEKKMEEDLKKVKKLKVLKKNEKKDKKDKKGKKYQKKNSKKSKKSNKKNQNGKKSKKEKKTKKVSKKYQKKVTKKGKKAEKKVKKEKKTEKGANKGKKEKKTKGTKKGKKEKKTKKGANKGKKTEKKDSKKYQKKNKNSGKKKEKKSIRQCKDLEEKYDKVAKYVSAEEDRQYHLQRCFHQHKYIFYSCVYDASRGLHKTKEEYEAVAKFINDEKDGLKKCFSTGDPHISCFGGSKFDVYNVETKKRELYGFKDLRVYCDLKFDKRWGTRAINDVVYVQKGNQLFTLNRPENRQFKKCSPGGLHYKEETKGSLQKFTLTFDKTVVEVEANIDGYLNVYITAPTSETLNANGDCTLKVPAHVEKFKGVTYEYGNPYTIKFRDACERKKAQIEICKNKCKEEKEVVECIKKEAGKKVEKPKTVKPTKKYVKKSTSKPTTRSTKKPTTKNTTKPTAKATTKSKPTTKYTTRATTKPTAKATTKATTKPTTKATQKPTTRATTKPTTKATTKPTTKYVTRATTKPTTKATQKPTTRSTTKPTTKSTTKPTTKYVTKATTKPTTKATTKPTTKATTKPTTKYVTKATTRPTTATTKPTTATTRPTTATTKPTTATTRPTTKATTTPTTKATTKPTTKYVTKATTRPTTATTRPTTATTRPTTKATTRPTVPVVATAKPVVCQSHGDPHYLQFDGKKFDFYTFGDWKLLESSQLTVHTRTAKWNSASVNTEVITKCNSNLLRTTGEANSLLIDGNKVTFKNGDNRTLKHGCSVSFSQNNRALITAKNGAVVELRLNVVSKGPQPFYSDVTVRVPNVNEITDGLCLGKRSVAQGLFNHVKKVEQGSNPSQDCTGKKREEATKRCTNAGIRQSSLEDCIIDVCEGFPLQSEVDSAKDRNELKGKSGNTLDTVLL